MNVVAVRVLQAVADKSPWPFALCPGSEKLDWITVWLRPAAVALKRFVKPPAEIALSFSIFEGSPRFTSCRFVPTFFPNVHADSADRVDIGSAADFVMAEDSRAEKKRHRIASAEARVRRKCFQYSAKLISQLASA